MKKNKVLIVLIVILSLFVVGLGGYVVYDNVLDKSNIKNDMDDSNNSVKDNNTTNNDSSTENINIDSDLKEKLKNTFGAIYYFITSPNPYCGEYTSTNKLPEDGGNYYRVSTEYSSYQEMINRFKKYASEEVLTSNRNVKKNYLEENGKLYCKDFGKGGVYEYKDSFLNVKESSDNKISTNIIALLTAGTDYYAIESYDVVFEKNNNNEFVITSIKNNNYY